MGTKTITVTEEAYQRLREMKQEGESFTDVVLRVTGSDRNVMKGFGSMKDVDGFRESVEEVRDELDEDFRGRAERR